MKSPNTRLSHQGSRAQSEAQLQFESQHAFELSLEEMLMEVKTGWGSHCKLGKKEEKPKKVAKETMNKEEPSPGWQKIWYKRLG